MAWNDTARIVDVSHWQEPASLDWAGAPRNGLVGAIVKYTQGESGLDPAASDHADAAYEAGVALLGGYHFGDGGDPVKQAAHFLDAMAADWPDGFDTRLVMLDAETNKPQMSVRQAELFVAAVHDRLGRWPWLYMGRYGPDGTGKGLPSAILSHCPLLVPAYGDHAGNLGAVLPPGWRLPRDGADRGEADAGVVRGWQFTDGRTNGGPFPGLGRVDQSRLVGIASLAEAEAVWINAPSGGEAAVA
jgi:lysozyme